jgi:hypothetical protein
MMNSGCAIGDGTTHWPVISDTPAWLPVLAARASQHL